MRKAFILFFFFLILAVFFVPGEAFAQNGLVPCGGESQVDCNLCHLFQLVSNILTFFLVPSGELNNNVPLIPVVAGFLIALGGFFFVVAAGDPGRVETGKQILTAVVIGLVIIYGSWIFIAMLLTALDFASFAGTGGTWWKIDCAF
jgi:hypothetical protein